MNGYKEVEGFDIEAIKKESKKNYIDIYSLLKNLMDSSFPEKRLDFISNLLNSCERIIIGMDIITDLIIKICNDFNESKTVSHLISFLTNLLTKTKHIGDIDPQVFDLFSKFCENEEIELN